MLKYRLITALVLIPLVICGLFLLPPLGFAIAIIIICMLGAWEWAQLAGIKSASGRLIITIIMGILLVSLLWHTPDYHNNIHQYQISGWLWLSSAWWIVALFLVMFYPTSAAFWKHSVFLKLVFGILTLIPFFWGMLALRHLAYGYDIYHGAWWLLYVLLLVWSADTGAYVFGKLLGKHKMAPKVSPGKTWEGLVGGLVTSAVIAWLFSWLAKPYLQAIPDLLIVGSVITVFASVLGDLTESMFKREAGVKDSSHLIPGHGGVLDRIDSLTAAVPVFTCFMLFSSGA